MAQTTTQIVNFDPAAARRRIVAELDAALAENARLLDIIRRARSLGARSGTNLNWANDLFDLLDEADRRP